MAINKDYIITELFFGFQQAKRMLKLDHPLCDCGKPAIGCLVTVETNCREKVEGRCTEHWPDKLDPQRWAVCFEQEEDGITQPQTRSLKRVVVDNSSFPDWTQK